MTYPTASRCFLFVALLGAILAGCQTKTTTDEDATLPNDNGATGQPADGAINSTASVLLKTIVGSSDEGIIRGISFGDDVGKVRASESRAAETRAAEPFEMFEDSLRHVGYTFETDQLETIDVLYYFTPTGRMVNKITVDVYLNSEEATQQLWQAAKKRFTDQYGAPLEDKPRHLSWKKAPAQVTMDEVSEGKDYGLKMVFVPTDKTMLAINFE